MLRTRLTLITAAIGMAIAAASATSAQATIPRHPSQALVASTTPSGFLANWAGYVAQSQTYSNFYSAYGDWVVPTVHCNVTPNSSASEWAGIGGMPGSHSDILYQAGTTSDCNKGHASYTAFWEYWPGLPTQTFPTPNVVKAKDHIVAYAEVDNGALWVGVSDYGQSWPANGHAQWSHYKKIDMNTQTAFSGECIVERTAVNSKPQSLTDFGSVLFDAFPSSTIFAPGCQVLDLAGPTGSTEIEPAELNSGMPGDVSAYPITMLNTNTNKPLATVSSPSADGHFTVTWKAPN